jgi:hypothetical protein
VRSVVLEGLLRAVSFDLGRNSSADLRIEPVASEQRVRTLAALARIRDAGEAARVACQETFRGHLVGRHRHIAIVGRHPSRSLAALPEDQIDRGAVDALETQLLADRPLTSRPGAVARLDPGTCERLVVEHTELEHPGDGTFDQIGAIARPSESPANFRNRSSAWLEETRRCLKDHVRILDLSSTLTPLVE